MKKILFTVSLPLFLLFYSGCSNDSGGTGTDPFGGGGIGGGGGGGGTGNVTIQVQGQQEQDAFYFYIKPSVPIMLVSVTASVPAANYTESIDINENFNNTGFQSVIKYATGVQSGQQWTLRFKGTITNGGQAFDVTTNYTIP